MFIFFYLQLWQWAWRRRCGSDWPSPPTEALISLMPCHRGDRRLLCHSGDGAHRPKSAWRARPTSGSAFIWWASWWCGQTQRNVLSLRTPVLFARHCWTSDGPRDGFQWHLAVGDYPQWMYLAMLPCCFDTMWYLNQCQQKDKHLANVTKWSLLWNVFFAFCWQVPLS